jgi:hypothetical protein
MANANQSGNVPDAQLGEIRRVLEDLYILHALTSGIGRENIRSVLRVSPSRISKIMKGIKKARKHAKEEA